MAQLTEIIEYCRNRVGIDDIADFPGAGNGLQFEGKSKVAKVGAAVDAGVTPFKKAAEAGIDFLIVHHGMFWRPPYPFVGSNRERLKVLFENNMSVYGIHLPLDAHREIGNNALIAKELGLEQDEWFLEYEGTKVGLIAKAPESREILADRLKVIFPKTFMAIEFGSDKPERVAISSGSGNMPAAEVKALGIDTLITGEVDQHNYNLAQEHGLNLYPCGHYATEVFGVRALAQELSEKFGLPYQFIATDCLL